MFTIYEMLTTYELCVIVNLLYVLALVIGGLYRGPFVPKGGRLTLCLLLVVAFCFMGQVFTICTIVTLAGLGIFSLTPLGREYRQIRKQLAKSML